MNSRENVITYSFESILLEYVRYMYVYGVVLRHVHVQAMYAMYGGCSLRLYKHVTDAPKGKHRSTKT
jgi:hypothetical protein